jgi:flavodoxin
MECLITAHEDAVRESHVAVIGLNKLSYKTSWFCGHLTNAGAHLACAGAAFGIANWIRVVFATPQNLLEEAWDRIELFCLRHSLQH